MKKLLYLLLLTPIIFLISCSSATIYYDIDEEMEILKDKYWSPNSEFDGSNHGIFFSKTGDFYMYNPQNYILMNLGKWRFSGATIYIDNNQPAPSHSWGRFNYKDTQYSSDGKEIISINLLDPSATDGVGKEMQFIRGIETIYGCTEPYATNYDSIANVNDESCSYSGCTDPDALNYNPNSNSDDGSCIPMIFDSLKIGDFFRGGIIFHLFENGGGLVAAANFSPNLNSPGPALVSPFQHFTDEWCNYNVDVSGASGTAIGTGRQNTPNIVGVCPSGYNSVAYKCYNLSHNGYNDWFLPSKDELNAMYLNIGQGNALGLGNIGGFTNSGYWSSSQVDALDAWANDFGGGYSYTFSKNYPRRGHPVRFFQIFPFK